MGEKIRLSDLVKVLPCLRRDVKIPKINRFSGATHFLGQKRRFCPGESHPLPGVDHPLPSADHPLPSANHPLPSASHPPPSASHPLPSAKTPLPSASRPLPSVSRSLPFFGYPHCSTAQTTTYDLDNLGRVTTITYPDSKTIQYQYYPP